MITGGKTRQDIDIHLNLFEKNFGKKMQNVASNLNNNLSQIQKTSKNFGISTESLEKYQRMFNFSLTKTGKSLRENQGNLILNSNSLNKYVGEHAGFGKVMRMNQEQFRKFNESGVKINRVGGRMANWLRKSTHGMRGFKMEMLGVMFFGMSLVRVFNGLIKTSLDWFGITEIMSTALGILFLPVAELVLEWALAFLEWVGNLTDRQKKLIGMFVLLGLALGGILMVFGTLALGIGSVIMAFGSLLSPIGLVVGGLLALAGYFILKDMFGDIGNASDKLKGKLVSFGVSGEAFDRVKAKIIEWYNVAKKYLFGDTETGEIGLISKIKDKISSMIDEHKEGFISAGKRVMGNIVEGAKQFFTDNPLILIGAIVGAIAGGPLGAVIGAVIGRGLENLDMKKMDSVIEKGKEILSGIVDGLLENKEKIGEAMEKIIIAISDWIANNADKLLAIGFAIVKGIVKGIAQAALNLGARIGNLITGKGWTKEGGFDLSNPQRTPWSEQQDFISRPGQGIVPFSSNDTIIGTKSGMGTGTILNVTYNVTVSDKREFEAMLKKNTNDITREVQRIIA